MSDIQGYCMKCKQYGPIKNGEKIVMSNGRTRMAGFVHNQAAPVKYRRSSHELDTPTYRIDLIEMSGGSTYLGLVV